MATRLHRADADDEAQTPPDRAEVRRGHRCALHHQGDQMKLVTYADGTGISGGVVIDDHVVPLQALDGAPTDVTALLAAGCEVAVDVAGKPINARQRAPL